MNIKDSPPFGIIDWLFLICMTMNLANYGKPADWLIWYIPLGWFMCIMAFLALTEGLMVDAE